MSTKYKIGDDEDPHFITFSIVNWIDVLTRPEYKDIIVDSLSFCILKKGLLLNAWVIMSNHVHLIMRAGKGVKISDLIRDIKKYTSKQIIKAVQDNQKESRKEWMLWMFERAGKRNCNNKIFQFWQQDNHPVQLSNEAMLIQRLNYLHQNPVKAGIVYEPQDYQYSSAIDYYTNQKGKIILDFII